jgi:phosphoglycerate dehydrogenase-like enzyme
LKRLRRPRKLRPSQASDNHAFHQETRMTKVAFVGAFAASLLEPVRQRLDSSVHLFACDEASAVTHLGDVDVVVSMAFSRTMAQAATGLKLVQAPGAGVDRVDLTALRPETHLANVYGHETGIAEYVFGAMLALTRSFGRLDRKLRSGVWESQWAIDTPAPPLWPELAGKTLGILGYGHIGQALARRAVAFDMQVWAIRRDVPPERPPELAFLGGAECLHAVMRQADYLAVTLPLSDATRDLIGADALRVLKPTAFLINVGRGEIINEAALYRCLAERAIAGAALDVWYRYPTTTDATLPASQPFYKLDNVLMTPHVSGWTEGMLASRTQLIAENIGRVMRGEPPLNKLR